MRAALYCRVSTQEQALNLNVMQQLQPLRKFIEFKEWEFAGGFCDGGVSGVIPLEERWAGSRLLQAIQAGQVEVVLVYRVDRLARNLKVCVDAIDVFERAGVAFVSATESFDTSTPFGKAALGLLAIFAQLEKDVIAERMSGGRQRRVSEGAYLASIVPYGYERDPATRNLRPHPWTSVFVRYIYRWSIAGQGLQEIADQLKTLRIPVPSNARKAAREWHPTTVYKYLTDRRYLGEASYGGQPMRCPAIIDEQTFRAAKEALKRRRTHSGPKPKHPYLLKGKLFCRRCGSLYYVDTLGSGGPRKGQAVYRCGGLRRFRDRAPSHEGVYKTHWLASEPDRRIKEFIIRVMNDPDRLLDDAEIWEQAAAEIGSDSQQEEARLRAQLDRLDGERQRAIDLRVEAMITHAEAAQRLSRIESQRAELGAKLRALQQRPADGDTFRLFARHLRDCAAKSIPVDDHVGREEVESLIARIWVEDNGDLTIEGRIPSVIPARPQDVGKLSPAI
jgi:site-specific DNA recombinase